MPCTSCGRKRCPAWDHVLLIGRHIGKQLYGRKCCPAWSYWPAGCGIQGKHLMWPEVLPGLVPRDLQALVAQLPGRRQAPLRAPPLAFACVKARRAQQVPTPGHSKRKAVHATESAGAPGHMNCSPP